VRRARASIRVGRVKISNVSTRGFVLDEGRAGDDDVLVLPPLPADPLFVDAVDEAVAGSVDDLPDAQPERIVGADPRDFASVYIRHRASFGLHARRFLNDSRDVDEVLQEAFLRLFLAMPELENELQVLSYCRRTVTNLCIDRYRADQRRPRLVDLEAVDWDPSDQASYDDPVLRAEDAAIVRQALALLTPMHRAALVKREIEEKPLPQIASELGIPEESVKHLLYRARRALRRLLIGTSVEPGADLSNSQLMRLANERLARATLRSANVLIVLFVAAVTVVGALRVGLQDQQRRSGEEVSGLSSPAFGLGDNPGASPRPTSVAGRTSAASSRHRPTHSMKPSSTPVATAPVVPAAVAKVAPKRDAWHVVPTRATQPKVSSGPAYSLRGSLHPTGPVQVQPMSRVVDSANGTVATSVLSAPTTSGVFSLTQTVAQSADGSASVTVLPQLASSNGVITAGVASSAAVMHEPLGTIAVDVVSTNTTAGASPVGNLKIHLVLDSALTNVLSESVVVGPLSQATSLAPVVTPPTVPSPTPPPTTGGSAAVTTTASVVATALPISTVIGMSPESMDDPQGQDSSTYNGGSVPLLPSPAQP
jgi:RNA polymerase sigma-70 factor, ECF subfamily